MRRLLLSAAAVATLIFSACGDGATPARSLSARQALTAHAELMEFETPQARQDLFREVARISQQEAGQETSEPVLFPVIRDGRMFAAPALAPDADLLQAPDSGNPLSLHFSGREVWPQERRDALGGLSEREAAELVARTLITLWELEPEGEVLVDRATGAPYAAAWVDGILRINPSFLYMAASVVTSSAPLAPPLE